MIIPSIANVLDAMLFLKFINLPFLFSLLFLTSVHCFWLNMLVSYCNLLFTWLAITFTLWKTLMTLGTNLNLFLPQTILCFLLVFNLFLLMFQFKGLDCLEKRLREFHYSSIEIEKILSLVHLCVRQSAFVFNGFFLFPN